MSEGERVLTMLLSKLVTLFDELAGTPPIEPAPIVMHDVAVARHLRGSSPASRRSSSTKTGSTLPRDAQRARQRAAVGRDDRRFAGRIDLGQQQRVGAGQHLDEVLEQSRVRV